MLKPDQVDLSFVFKPKLGRQSVRQTKEKQEKNCNEVGCRENLSHYAFQISIAQRHSPSLSRRQIVTARP